MSAAGRTLEGTERPAHIASLLGDDGLARAAAPPIHLFFPRSPAGFAIRL